MAEEKKTTEDKLVSTESIDATAVESIDTTVKGKATKKPVAAKKIKTAKGKKKVLRQVSLGRAYIKATYNNTLISFTDQNGNVLATSSAGENGFSGPRKATPYAASVIVKKASEKVVQYGLKEVNVFVKGVGMGRESAIRSINANGINILSIKDVTPIPHNGCRRRKPRRV
ncbi:30S ribosomal protein S11 [Candidatus Falkowbacteria bacterium CG10_big_fil_rev_8_21_14_0_10_39_11]|uniref:Small ribosomal subunit protein uS11 n=1 Tax=Candidatus Falkowbacteria bacterium CG10_big_fil_rev_8_21_14_0_10_39_11 TaxID=1974565 RepID=A0A2H0V5N2_9BACT|nr:MAG: 30S ribosomal protein S11 [Candidatus Falkowbacteria bacterium CG10_big_fil_rev_8_21_14_0_10_39_11]